MSDHKRILIVDDEARMRRFVRMNLELEGFDVLEASDGLEAIRKAREEMPDLVILDVEMPRLDGFETLREIRRTLPVPVIMLTVRSEEDDLIRGLDLGADDYVNKPFSPRELASRIRAVLRRTQAGQQPLQSARRLQSRHITLDRSSRRVFLDGREVPLTPKSVSILEHFMTHPDELITRERLLDVVWGWESGVGERVVDTRIVELRRALQDDSANPQYIETVPNAGYRYIAPVIVAPTESGR